MAERYDHDQVELKWQKIWEDAHCFEAKDDYSMPKFYPLIEFPYPSGTRPSCRASPIQHRIGYNRQKAAHGGV